jgi:MYXO-CTERM domain-containing protein
MSKRFLKAASAAVCALTLTAASSPGAQITTSAQQPAGENWNNPAIWSNNAPPSPGNTYEIVLGATNPARIRNPDPGGVQTFAGDSLTVNASTEIRTKGPAGTVLNFPGVGGAPGLILNGGTINTGDNVVFGLSGNMIVSTTSTFDFGDGTGGAIAPTRAVNITAPIAGSGTLRLRTAGVTNPLDIQSANNNTFSGGWDVVSGFLKGTGVNSLGTGNISIAPSAAGGARFDTDYPMDLPGASLILAPANGANNAVMLLDQTDRFGSVTINGTTLAPGTYSASQLLTQFPANFDPASTGSITVVPEPSAFALAGAVGILALRRRRARTA